jgi:hypothetical protein
LLFNCVLHRHCWACAVCAGHCSGCTGWLMLIVCSTSCAAALETRLLCLLSRLFHCGCGCWYNA